MTRRRRKPPAKSFVSSELTAMIYDLLALDPPKTHGAILERVLKRLESGNGPTQSQLRKIEQWFETNLPQHRFDTDPEEFFQMIDEIPKTNRSLKLEWTIQWCRRSRRRTGAGWRPTLQQYSDVRNAWLEAL
ncbi:MAG: hypothetical protein AAFR51_04045 [Pseudomonadota bacterium]